MKQKNDLFAGAFALLHLNTIPERFGLVLAEANAAGVPVIAMDLGSCREVIDHGVTGFLVNDVCGAVKALEEVPAIADDACRRRVQERFLSRRWSRVTNEFTRGFSSGLTSEDHLVNPKPWDVLCRNSREIVILKDDDFVLSWRCKNHRLLGFLLSANR